MKKETICWRDFVEDHWICRCRRLDIFLCSSIVQNGHNKWKIISTHMVYESIYLKRSGEEEDKKVYANDLTQCLRPSNHSIHSIHLSVRDSGWEEQLIKLSFIKKSCSHFYYSCIPGFTSGSYFRHFKSKYLTSQP